jgi:protein SSD1
MTDELTQPSQPPPKKDEKKPSSANTRGPNKRNVSITSNSKQSLGGSTQAPRPSSRTGNKKTPTSAPSSESGLDATTKKSSESGKKPEQRNKNQVGASRAPAHRKAQPSASQGGRNNSPKEQPSIRQSSTPVPQSKEASDALSSLQRVIADLKTTSPVQPPAAQNNGFAMPVPQHQSNLPPNAPVFQPGAPAYPGSNADPKHRKAVSLGAAGLSGNFSSYSPHLGAMAEDVEDGVGVFEEGEIQEHYLPHQGHQPRSQSQSFMAPRFAALAAQQEQSDSVGPTGRPQLAPNFMFGARKQRGTPLGPPINEEDLGFQFPQQQQQQSQNYNVEFPTQEQTHKKSDSGEITGIMAEQVVLFATSTSVSANDLAMLDRPAESNRGVATTTASSLSTAACIKPSPIFPNSGTCTEPRCS